MKSLYSEMEPVRDLKSLTLTASLAWFWRFTGFIVIRTAAAKIPKMVMTTSNSIKVKPRVAFLLLFTLQKGINLNVALGGGLSSQDKVGYLWILIFDLSTPIFLILANSRLPATIILSACEISSRLKKFGTGGLSKF